METNENILFSNSFGSVTDKRIILNYKSGTEDLPVGQITSVSYQYKRNYIFAIGGFLITIGGFYGLLAPLNDLNSRFKAEYEEGIPPLIFLFFIIVGLLSGIANWIGHNNIQISAGGKDRKPLRVERSRTREGREFVDAVKRVIFSST